MKGAHRFWFCAAINLAALVVFAPVREEGDEKPTARYAIRPHQVHQLALGIPSLVAHPGDGRVRRVSP